MERYIKKIIFAIFLIVFFSLFFIFKLYKYFSIENMNSIKVFFNNFYILGPIIIILLFISFNLAVLPTFYFIIISGYLYGPIFGFLLGWLGMTIGLYISFINSRYIFRDDFIKKFENKKFFKKLNELTKKYNGWIVILFRLFFIIPYNFQNVTYGLTSIKTYIYTICSSIGILPISFLYSLLGYLLSNGKIRTNDLKTTTLIISLFLIFMGIIITISIIFRKKLNLNEK